MRWIKKHIEPTDLTYWRRDNKVHKNEKNFNRLTGDLKEIIKLSLLDEQRYLCAYTGHSIDLSNSHIEHLKPQNYCTNGEDVEYNNFVACYPGIDPKTAKTVGCPKAKDNWPSPEEKHQFVSPLDKSCENRFCYRYNGKVRATNDTDDAAKKTIDKLSLNNDLLCDYRKRAILGTLSPTRTKKISINEAKRIFERLKKTELEQVDKLKSFHFVITQVLDNYIKSSQK